MHTEMSIAIHRERDGRVPSQRLGNFRRHVGSDEVGNESVPERMEIDHATVAVLVS
jgi:hypothetical protein